MIGAFGGRVSFANGSVLTNDGTIAADAGTVDVGGALQGAGRVTITNGGRVEFAGGVAAAQQIDLSGSATLVIDQPGFFAGTISGFAPGDAIDLGIAATPVGYSAGDLTLLTSAQPDAGSAHRRAIQSGQLQRCFEWRGAGQRYQRRGADGFRRRFGRHLRPRRCRNHGCRPD